MNNKLNYLLRSSLNIFSNTSCPFCKHNKTRTIDRKYLVTSLLKCGQCGFQFRHPKDDEAFNNIFYQSNYQEQDGITTDLPQGDKLQALINNKFKQGGKNADRYISLISSLFEHRDTKSINILDYGCNWGYTSYQFQQAGFQVSSFEISKARAAFGNQQLGLNIHTNFAEVAQPVDVFFSSHVIEHHPNVQEMLRQAQETTNPEGYFIAYCPNGSSAFKEASPSAFHRAWGLVHPNYLSADFFQQVFKNQPYLIGSDTADFKEVISWDTKTQVVLDLRGVELFVIAKNAPL